MPAPRKYPNELRERAIRLVNEARAEEPGLSLNQVVKRIGPRVGVNPDTLRGWVEAAERAEGVRAPAARVVESEELRALRRENAELRRANEILKTASAYAGDRCQAGLSSRRLSRLS